MPDCGPAGPWRAATLLGLLLATLLMVGIRQLFMQTMQKRRERENRQINERLKTLIAAYKTLGGSFTGSLHVRPTHLRELRQAGPEEAAASSERQRRTRDAVEAALSDVILLGTPEQVALAATAARGLAAGRSMETAALVVSLRQFIREAPDLEPIAPAPRFPRKARCAPAPARAAGKKAAARAWAAWPWAPTCTGPRAGDPDDPASSARERVQALNTSTFSARPPSTSANAAGFGTRPAKASGGARSSTRPRTKPSPSSGAFRHSSAWPPGASRPGRRRTTRA